MKKITLIILFTIVITTVILPCFANNDILPLWDNTDGVTGNLYFNGTTGTFDGHVIGDNDVTDIYVTAYLYYKDSTGEWVYVRPWSFMSNSDTIYYSKNFSAESGVEYKVDYTAYVYVGTDCEEISFSTTNTCP